MGRQVCGVKLPRFRREEPFVCAAERSNRRQDVRDEDCVAPMFFEFQRFKSPTYGLLPHCALWVTNLRALRAANAEKTTSRNAEGAPTPPLRTRLAAARTHRAVCEQRASRRNRRANDARDDDFVYLLQRRPPKVLSVMCEDAGCRARSFIEFRVQRRQLVDFVAHDRLDLSPDLGVGRNRGRPQPSEDGMYGTIHGALRFPCVVSFNFRLRRNLCVTLGGFAVSENECTPFLPPSPRM